MAGVVAMASVIEDFETQPCKKSRKDGGSPVVKTITNYFSPVPKPAEKPFSPPRSNNIMSYFSRKAPSSKEKASSPEQLKENCQTSRLGEKQTNPEAAVKHLSQKRSRKPRKAARKLIGAEPVSSPADESCMIVEEPANNRDSATEVVGSCGVLGSDTAALLVQLSAEACITAGKSESNASETVSVEQADKEQQPKDVSECGSDVMLQPETNSGELSPTEPSKDKAKPVKTAAKKSKKRQPQEAKLAEPEEKETESSLNDVSMEVNVDEASQLNSSTVTVSFEDFVRSQGQDEDMEDEPAKHDGSKITTATDEMDTDQLDIPQTEENAGFAEPPLQISPRTVTIQAEVHVVSPKQEAKVFGKVASIFNRRKGEMGSAEASSPHTDAAQQLPSALNVKRKSNVVLQEDDLELAVLESESTPKCSEAERKQFMAAFKQPGPDGSKTKSGKGQGKQKQPGEKGLDDGDKLAEEETVIPPSDEHVPTAAQENKAKKKPAKKGRKKGKNEKETVAATPAAATPPPPPPPVEETVSTPVEADDKGEEPLASSTPSIPPLRRSRREAAIRQTPEAAPTTPVRKIKSRNESKDTSAALTGDSPANASTPKTRKSKHGVFVAEILSPPDTKQSPIRIKFTRVHKNITMSKTESGAGKDTSLATKASTDSKKRKQAKKLVEKARVLQQSKKDAAEGKRTLRRSSRAEASAKRSYCEDEDSVICVDDNQAATPQAAPEKRKTQKLRSLNDVLGKATPVGKESKAVSGSKPTSLGQDKTARKPSAVISIFDESSLEGSENSQGDEQFKARREFLKSGLPETFRKQIAKTAATKEAYSLSGSSFQPVTHVKQPPNDCPLWSLSWPQSALLSRLKELWGQTSDSPPSAGGSLCGKTEPAQRAFSEQGSGFGHPISESALQLLIEEVGTANPSFPVQRFITGFLKRCTDHGQQCAASETVSRVTTVTPQAEPVGGKRKRVDDEGETTAKMSKKQRANSSDEHDSTAEPTKRGRTRRSKPEKEANEEPSVRAAPVTTEDDLILVEDPEKKDVVKEDVLWTDKYQPQHSSEIIGNAASVKRLHSWLKEWKLRADREERKKQKDKKQEEGSNDSDWDCGDEDFQDGEDMLCNTVLITGPPGVGKTAAVYACAQELGFKVFEVNASSQRSGRLILSQLKEATQSHQVDSQGVNAHKPTYFNSYGTSSSAGTLRLGSSPRKVNSPRRVVSSPRKLPQSPRGAKRGGLAPTSLANFFKVGRPTKETANTKNGQTAASKKVSKANEGVNKDSAVKCPAAPTLKEKNSDEQSKKTATSLILFEEVDVIFDEDSGFLAAIKTFMTTTKRPVILTTSDPAFSTMFDGNFEEIHFQTPSVLDAGSFLRLLCLAEDTRTDLSDVNSLLKLNGCDIRQSLLQLQLWTRSGGGRNVTRPCGGPKPETEEVSVTSSVPPCKTGCTQSMLGLLNIEPDRDVWELLRNGGAAEEAISRELLANSRRRGVDLIYSNMEALLPLPLTRLTTSTYSREPSVSVSQDHPSVHPKELPSQTEPLLTAESADCSDDGSPVKMSNRMKSVKKQHRLSDRDGPHSDSDSEESFLSLCKSRDAPQGKEEVKQTSERIKRKPLTPEGRIKSLPVSQCLESLADFLDNMSYTDSFLVVHPEGGDNHRGTSRVGAVVKDGMTDESRVEADRWSLASSHRFLEIPAAVEALSFHKCRLSTAEAWDKVQKLEGKLRDEAAAELALPVAAHHQPFSFAQDGPCQPQLVQRRREIMESLMSRGVFGCLGNRSAAALDYLPALRTICRSETVKEQGKVKRRFLHYLDALHLGLVKSTLQHLAEDFP